MTGFALREAPKNPGRWETSTRKRWWPVDFGKPAGRWCLVSWCCFCGKGMRDVVTESAFSYSRWPKHEDGPRNSSWSSAHDVCSDCAQMQKVTDVRQCGACGAFKRFSPFGVYYRFNSHTCQQLGIGEMQCVSCWNRHRPLAKRFEEADAARLLINQVKRKIREASQVSG